MHRTFTAPALRTVGEFHLVHSYTSFQGFLSSSALVFFMFNFCILSVLYFVSHQMKKRNRKLLHSEKNRDFKSRTLVGFWYYIFSTITWINLTLVVIFTSFDLDYNI